MNFEDLEVNEHNECSNVSSSELAGHADEHLDQTPALNHYFKALVVLPQCLGKKSMTKSQTKFG